MKNNQCTRCGTCCQKGGPSFHYEDRMLIETGVIPSKYLYTIRKGELARDNVRGGLQPVPSDIIKIKGQRGGWTCHFFDNDSHQCRIYESRPVECRALKCWDSRELEQIYDRNRLTRQDLLSGIEGLWPLVEDHQNRCSYERIKRIVDGLTIERKDGALKKLSTIVHYDNQIRLLVVEKGGIDPAMCDFMFGRPLTVTIRMFGFTLKRKDRGYVLVPLSQK